MSTDKDTLSTIFDKVYDQTVGKDEIGDVELEYDNQLASLDAITSLEESVLSSQKVDRITMESLSRIEAEAISPQYPLVTYTQEPSQQNYEVALESFDVAKAVVMAAAGGLLGAILFYIIKLFRSDNVDTRIDYLEKAKETIKENKRSLKKSLRESEKFMHTPEVKETLRRIENYDISLIVEDIPRAPRDVVKFLEEVSPRGDIHRVLSKWSKDIIQYTSEFRKRVRLLTESIEVMYEVEYDEIAKLISKANSITVDGNHPFIKDIGAAWLLWQKLDIDEGYPEFVKNSVVGTDAFYEIVKDDRALTSYDSLYSASDKQLEKNLDELQKSAELLSGTKREEMKAKAQRSTKTRTSTKGNHATITIDAGASAINPMLVRAIRDAEDSIRNESSMLTNYRTLLGRVLYFYQHAAAARERLDNGFLRRAMEAQNSGQPK